VIVGGTKGIGAALAIALAHRGADVLISGRTDSEGILEKLKSANPTGKHAFIAADLQLIAGMVGCARKIEAAVSGRGVDLLILTTGIFAPSIRKETVDGLEWDFAVSTFSRYVLVKQLRSVFAEQKAGGRIARIFVMGFPGAAAKADFLADPQGALHYDAMEQHMRTVQGNEAMVYALAKAQQDYAVFALNPGLIATDVRRELTGHGFVGNMLERLVSIVGRSMSGYVEATLPLFASPSLSLVRSGAAFNTYGQAIDLSPSIDDTTRASIGEYLEKLYTDKVEKKAA